MNAPPINLFAKRADPDAVRRHVLAAHPEAEVEDGAEGGWSSILIRRKRGLLKRAQTLRINHDPEYYTGPGWPRQRAGMKNHLLEFPGANEVGDTLRAVVDEFAFALSFLWEPPVQPGDEDDFRYELILGIGRRLDACFFLPGHLLDAEGRILVAADGEADPEAEFPPVEVIPQPAAAPAHRPEGGGVDPAEEGDPEEPDPPSPGRVAGRALVLAAVSARGLLELQASEMTADAEELEAARGQGLAWCLELGLEGEIEPAEREVLECPLGGLSERQHLDAIWRLEGLAVLAWALGRFELPAYDEVVRADDLLPAIGFLDLAAAAELLRSAELLPAAQLETFNHQMLAYHWRLRDFGLRPQAMNFRRFGDTCWFGPVDMAWARFDGDDLALVGTAIHRAESDVVGACSSIVAERHLASNWLRGWSEVYSETDTST